MRDLPEDFPLPCERMEAGNLSCMLELGLGGKRLERSYFLSSRMELGFFISINAQPNFYRKRMKKAISFARFCRKTSPEHSLCSLLAVPSCPGHSPHTRALSPSGDTGAGHTG